jgi:thioredoxin
MRTSTNFPNNLIIRDATAKMSKTIHITSTDQFSTLLSNSSIVVADFYADWCGPCKQIAPMYEQLSQQLTRPNKISFTKINVDQQTELAGAYGVTAMPTFMVFKNARAIQTIRGADPKKLSEVVKKLANEANAVGDGATTGGFGESSGGGSMWLGAALPKGFRDVTDQVDLLNLELLNMDSEFGGARALFAAGKPEGEHSRYSEQDCILTCQQRKLRGRPGWRATPTNKSCYTSPSSRP